MPLEFGSVAPCRKCTGLGKVRHAADPAAERERARLRRRGQSVPRPPAHDPCPTCQGEGFLPIAQVDH